MQFFIFALGLVLFIGLVLVHEWGHYIMARRNGVDVEEFGLGFPPQAFSRKLKSGMRLSFNILPLGGFVKMKGENDSDKRKGSFGAADMGAKTKILLAGVTMNLIVGLLFLMIAAWIGMPKLLTKDSVGQEQFTVASDTKVINQQVLVGPIQPGSPAQKVAATKLLSDKEVEASQNTDNPKGHLGIVPSGVQIQRSTWSAPIVAIGLSKQIFVLTFQGLGHAFSGLGSAVAGGVTGNHDARVNGQDQASSQVGGPVAIGVALWNSGTLGFHFMLFLIALISLTLALMNILPIPALDGGRLMMMWVSRGIFKRPLSRMAEERIVGASFMFLLALIALITIVDVKRFF
jgi:regulator of sigma E protease